MNRAASSGNARSGIPGPEDRVRQFPDRAVITYARVTMGAGAFPA